jgi:hypothetical protein
LHQFETQKGKRSCWLSEKHRTFVEKAEWEKAELVEAHAMELAGLRGDLDLETRSYTEYRQNVRHRLHELHEAMALSFHEVHAWCLPFPSKGVKVEERIDLVAGEVKTVLDTIWQLNDSFTMLGVKGILSMLNNEGWRQLGLGILNHKLTDKMTVLARFCKQW